MESKIMLASDLASDKDRLKLTIDAGLALLRECGESVRACGNQMSSLLRNFFTLNTIALAAFTFSFTQLPSRALPSSTEQRIESHTNPANKRSAAMPEFTGTFDAFGESFSIPKVLAVSAALIGLIASVAAFVSFYRLTSHSRYSLARAGEIESFLSHVSSITDARFDFYRTLVTIETRDRKKPFTTVTAGYLLFILFSAFWFVAIIFGTGFNVASVGV